MGKKAHRLIFPFGSSAEHFIEGIGSREIVEEAYFLASRDQPSGRRRFLRGTGPGAHFIE